jgi:xylulokinase
MQCCYCHVVNDKYFSFGFFPSAGLILRWYRDTFAEKEKEESKATGRDIYDILTQSAAESSPGANGLLLLPHFAGSGSGEFPAMNLRSKGALIGLSLSHKKSDVVRSILEGITFELRMMIDHLEKSDVKVTELRAIGGGAKSQFWLQLKADITNRRVILPGVSEAASLGASILAGLATKEYNSVEHALSNTYKEIGTYEPNSNNVEKYNKLYSVYKRIYPQLVGVFEELSSS